MLEVIQDGLGEGGWDGLALIIPFYPNCQMFSDGELQAGTVRFPAEIFEIKGGTESVQNFQGHGHDDIVEGHGFPQVMDTTLQAEQLTLFPGAPEIVVNQLIKIPVPCLSHPGVVVSKINVTDQVGIIQ